MIPALLTHFKKRAYPDYRCERDPDIWPSRHHLLDYEQALELEALVDEILEAELPLKSRESTVGPKNRPVTPALSAAPRTPLTTPKRAPQGNIKLRIPDPPKFDDEMTKKEESDQDYLRDKDEDVDPVQESIQIQRARKIIQFLDEWILNRWEFHLDLKPENSDRPPSLQRFEPGKCAPVYSYATSLELPHRVCVYQTVAEGDQVLGEGQGPHTRARDHRKPSSPDKVAARKTVQVILPAVLGPNGLCVQSGGRRLGLHRLTTSFGRRQASTA
jgi:hypothetical protein